MKATKAMLTLVENCKSKADLDSLVNAIAVEKDLPPSKMASIKAELTAKFNESRTKYFFQVAIDRRGQKWLNLYRMVKRRDGTFDEISKFTKKTFNAPLAEAEMILEQLQAQLPTILADAHKAKPVND